MIAALFQGFIVDDKDKATHIIVSAPPAQQNDGILDFLQLHFDLLKFVCYK